MARTLTSRRSCRVSPPQSPTWLLTKNGNRPPPRPHHAHPQPWFVALLVHCAIFFLLCFLMTLSAKRKLSAGIFICYGRQCIRGLERQVAPGRPPGPTQPLPNGVWRGRGWTSEPRGGVGRSLARAGCGVDCRKVV